MGLNIYLYHCADRPAAKALEEEYEKRTDGLWEKHCAKEGEWDKLPKDEQDRRYEVYKAEKEKIAAAMGLNDDGQHPGVKKIEKPSKKYPEHLFKVGYFRSSYNPSGINNVMRQRGLPTLDEIMGAPSDEYEFTPDWKASKLRAVGALDSYLGEKHGDIAVIRISANIFKGPETLPDSEEKARAMVIETLEREHGSGSFSNGYGDFWIDQPLEVVAMLPGLSNSFEKRLFGKDMLCTYVAYRKQREATNSYAQSLEIMVETCDYVLAKKDPQNYYLHWSG